METDYELKTKQSLHINLLLGFLGVGRSPIQDNISMCIHDIFYILLIVKSTRENTVLLFLLTREICSFNSLIFFSFESFNILW